MTDQTTEALLFRAADALSRCGIGSPDAQTTARHVEDEINTHLAALAAQSAPASPALADALRQCVEAIEQTHIYPNMPGVDRARIDKLRAALAAARAALDGAPAEPQPAPAGDALLLDDDESDPIKLWAEIVRLREALKGPAGYASWQEAATDERARRVRAEGAIAAKDAEIADWRQRTVNACNEAGRVFREAQEQRQRAEKAEAAAASAGAVPDDEAIGHLLAAMDLDDEPRFVATVKRWCSITRALAAPAAGVPTGWRIRRSETCRFPAVDLTAPNGDEIQVIAPDADTYEEEGVEGMLYRLADALLGPAAAEPTKDES